MISRREFLAHCIAAGAGIASGRYAAGGLNCDKPVEQRVPKASFVRVFPEADNPLESAEDESALAGLAKAMTASAEPPSAASLNPGYTYFGQFIDHDLTWNDVAFDDPYEKQIAAQNFRSPFLDLDSVYGDGPPLKCQFEGPAGAESFVIGLTAASPALGLKGGRPCDVPFENGNRPIIGDRLDLRNAENLILRQLHVVFIKCHNQVIAQLPQHSKDPDLPQEGNLFDRARRLVTWTYQWLVWHDFLERIRATGTRRSPKRLDELPNTVYRLPLEFVLAGFRFGHSMVQGEYALNCHHAFSPKRNPAPLSSLINGSKETAERLTEEYAIEWGRFFPGLGTRLTLASRIDTHINPGLAALPAGTLLTFSKASRGPENPNLAYRTLLRGARARLASGQQVAARLKEKDKMIRNISDDLKKDEALQKAGLTENTPLWFYILKEAEVTESGDALGKVGTHIVEDALEGALQYDRDSFLVRKGSDWKPPEWILPKERPDIASLIKFAQADGPVEGCASHRG
jgi:Animal haem peroxidase